MSAGSPGSSSQGGWLSRAVGRITGRMKRDRAAFERAERLRKIYELFREILAINDSTLQLIADLEDRLSGRAPFSYNMMVTRVNRAVMDIFVMVKDLNQIADGRYSDLYDAVRRVNVAIEAETMERKERMVGRVVVPLPQLSATEAPLAGNKMANLGEIKNVLGLTVPDGFVISTAAFARFMGHNDLWEKTERLEEVLEAYGSRVTSEACREVQSAILAAPVPDDVSDAIHEGFDALARGSDLLVALRSSAVKEDGGATHAGQYYTELNVGRGWLLDSYRWVLASAYSLEAVAYRLGHGMTAADTPMAVGCIKMVDARCSGIMFSRWFEDASRDRVAVSAVPGLAAEVAAGTVNAEELLIDADAGPPASEYLSADEVRELWIAARRLEEHFSGPQDVEWAYDRDGKLFILQSRPMVTLERPAEETARAAAEEKFETDREPLLSGGHCAYAGAAAGPVFVIRDDADLDRFPAGAVLVARHSSPKFSRVMGRAAAIITDLGSPTGHMAIISREFGVPTIVGLTDATARLSQVGEVTVDSGSRNVYEGLLIAARDTSERKPEARVTPAVVKLRRIARAVSPLHLVDPASRDFVPAKCHSLHDITRFVHEKVFEVMFTLSDKFAGEQPNSFKLEGNLPYDVWVFDVGGGFADRAGSSGRLMRSDVISVPFQAFCDGLLDERIKWDQPRAVSARGFMSVLGESMAGPPAEVQGVGKASFAIVSDRYMNFSTKAGYHFNTVDTYCGKSLNKNYIHWRFAGGGAGELRRSRRCKFLTAVLEALDFKVTRRGDLLVARLEKFDTASVQARLADLGRLTLCSRQLDMLMDTDQSPDIFARAFLAGEFNKF